MNPSNWKSRLAPIGVAAIVGLLASPTALATAPGLFEGYFAVTDAAHPAGIYNTGNYPLGGTLGGWTATLTPGGQINTFGAPDSIYLSADSSSLLLGGRGSNLSPLVASAGSLARLTIMAPSAGTFSFNMAIEVGQLGFIVGAVTTPLNSGGSFLFEIPAGQTFGFEVLSDFNFNSPLVSPRGVAQPAAFGGQGIGISNPLFVGVPESSTWAAGLVMFGLIGSACWNRTRRR